MRKVVLLFFAITFLTTGIVYAQKYKVNTSGVVKNQSGQVLSSPANAVNQSYYNIMQPATSTVISPSNTNPVNIQTGTPVITNNNYYNNYQAQNYIDNNQVNNIPVEIVEFVMDYSGSMANWVEVAKRSMSSIVAQLPSTTRVGFRVFGHDNNGNNPANTNSVGEVKKIVKKGNKFVVVTEKSCLGSTKGVCSATKQVTPITTVNVNALLNGMNSVYIGGATPLVYALDRAVYQDFSNLDKVTPKKIVLITDGGENCGGDPCAFAKNLMKKRSDVHIDVVLVASNSKALACLTQTTGGHFFTVNNLSNFTNTITNSIKTEPTNVSNSSNQNYEFAGE